MAKRSPEISELSCTWGLFSILECRNGCANQELISKGSRPVKRDIIGICDFNFESTATVNPRDIDQLPNFDEGYRKIQNEANLPSISVDRDHIREGKSIVNHKNKQIKVKAHQPTKKDSEFLDNQLKTQKKAKKKSQNAHQSTSRYSIQETSLIQHLPSNSAEISLKNKLTISAILSGAHNQKQGAHLAKMRAKYFVDQMFIGKKFIHNERATSESKPFSNALEVLNSKKISGKDIQPSDKIVLMKPVTMKSTKRSENVACYCSSLQIHQKTSQRVPNAKNTSFSFREVRRKLKHSFGGTNANIREKISKKELKLNLGYDFDTMCRKSELSVKFPNKVEFDLILEAKRHLSARLQNINDTETLTSKRSTKTLGRILFSPECEGWSLSPRSNSQSCYGSPDMRFSPYRPSFGVTQRTSQEVMSSVDSKKHEGESKIVELNSSKQRTDTIELHDEDEISTMNSALPLRNLTSEDETFTITDDSQSPKCREEHQSPVSVLEPFFTDSDNSPTSIMLQSRPQPLQALVLDFEECLYKSPPQDPPITDEQDYIFCYVHSVLKASCLDWDKLSEISSQPEELFHESLFDEVEFLSFDYFFNYKLLFDHMNEVLLQIYQSHFSSTRPVFIKREAESIPLEKLVLDEILKEADFYLLPVTEKRTLDQLVSKDMAGSSSWLNIRHDVEVIVNDVSEDIMEELMLDIILDELET